MYNMAVFEDSLYRSDIEPHPYTLLIWIPIYLWQVAWVCYGLYTLCQPGVGSWGYLYYSPPYMSVGMYVLAIVSLLLNVAHVFAWTWGRWDIALPLLALWTFALYITLYLAIRGIREYGLGLYNAGLEMHVALDRGLVQNGVAMFAAWTTIATLLSLADVLYTYAGVDWATAGSIALGILAGEMLIWFILDWFIFERHLRYIFTPYIVLVVFLVGSLVAHYNPWVTNTIITVVLLVVAAVAFLIKIIMATARICTSADPVLMTSTVYLSNSRHVTQSRRSSRLGVIPVRTIIDPRLTRDKPIIPDSGFRSSLSCAPRHRVVIPTRPHSCPAPRQEQCTCSRPASGVGCRIHVAANPNLYSHKCNVQVEGQTSCPPPTITPIIPEVHHHTCQACAFGNPTMAHDHVYNTIDSVTNHNNTIIRV